MKRAIITFFVAIILFWILNVLGIRINKWYFLLPLYFVVYYIVTVIKFHIENAIIMNFDFHGSEKSEDEKYCTQFNVEYYISFKKSAFLRGLINTDNELSKDDVLNIISHTKKKKIERGYKKLGDEFITNPPIFKYEYEYRGDKISCSYKPFEENQNNINDFYDDEKGLKTIKKPLTPSENQKLRNILLNKLDETISNYTYDTYYPKYEMPVELQCAYWGDLLRGALCAENKMFEETIEFINKGIEKDYVYLSNRGLYSCVLTNLGYAKKCLQKYDDALMDINEAIKLDLNNKYAYCNRGEICFAKEKYKEANEDFDKTIQLDPLFTSARLFKVYSLIVLKDYHSAISECNIIIDSNLNNKIDISVACLSRGVAKYNLEDKEGAFFDWSKADKLGNADAYDLIKDYCDLELEESHKIVKNVQNIGVTNYLFTIWTGKNRQVRQIIKRDWIDGNENKSEIIPGDFIITIGRKAVILTKYQDNRRVPIITKKWRRIENCEFDDFMELFANVADSSFTPKTYMDNDGLIWTYVKSITDKEKEWVTLHDEDGKVKYEIEII